MNDKKRYAVILRPVATMSVISTALSKAVIKSKKLIRQSESLIESDSAIYEIVNYKSINDNTFRGKMYHGVIICESVRDYVDESHLLPCLRLQPTEGVVYI